jgi:hypothetical protein
MPGPQGSTAAQVHALVPVPELLALLLPTLVLAALEPPAPPCPVDVAALAPPVPPAVVEAPPVPLVVALAPPLPLVPLAAVVSPPLPQPHTAASNAAGARKTIEDHRMKSSIPKRGRARTRLTLRLDVKRAGAPPWTPRAAAAASCANVAARAP